MATVNFADLRKEALDKAGYEPYVLNLGGEKKVEIPAPPFRVYTQEYELNNGRLTIQATQQFVRALFPTAEWPKVEPVLQGEPAAVWLALANDVMEHFGISMGSLDDEDAAEKSESSDE